MGLRFNIIKIVPQLTYKAIVIAVITQGAFFFFLYFLSKKWQTVLKIYMEVHRTHMPKALKLHVVSWMTHFFQF